MSSIPTRCEHRRWAAAAAYLDAAVSADSHRIRLRAVLGFDHHFGDLRSWQARPVATRMAAPAIVRAFAAFAAVFEQTAVDARYVVRSASRWGTYLGARETTAAAMFRAQATSLGFGASEADRMWHRLAQICVITGAGPDTISAQQYFTGRRQLVEAVVEKLGHSPKSLNTTLFGLDAVMLHRGQCPAPHPRKLWAARSVPEIGWDRVETAAPVMAATMRRYLDQIGISLRASSVSCIETTLRQFAGHLVTTTDITCVADIDRTHVEAYKTWLAARPGYRRTTSLPKTTIGMRMGHLRAFYQRIIEWDYPDIPARAPVSSSDRPIKDNPLPRFLDDGGKSRGVVGIG